MRPTFLGCLLLTAANPGALAAGDWENRAERIYRSVCARCHDSGLLDAPKMGDEAAWKPRIAEGQKALTRLATKGIRQMPPRGGNPSLTDAEVAAAVTHLVNGSGGKFKYAD